MEARRDTSVDADEAFEKAGKELDHYAKSHHPVHEFISACFTALCAPKLARAVLGNLQNIIHVAAKDKIIMKTQSRWRFSVGGGQTDIRRKSWIRFKRGDVLPGQSSQIRTLFQILSDVVMDSRV